MQNYIFKTYIDGGREYYEYTDVTDREQTIKKDFPFPESLMDLLYMDTQELEAITKKMDKALLAFYQSGAKDDLQVVAAGLNELASRHVYFELLRLDWTERLNAAERVTPKEYLRLLPHKKISHIYSNIDTMQRQIISLIAHALDMDGEKKSVSEKMVAYYNAEGNDMCTLSSSSHNLSTSRSSTDGSLPRCYIPRTSMTSSTTIYGSA